MLIRTSKVDTTVSRADYPDLRSVYAAEEEANTNLTTFRRQSERAQRVLKKNRKSVVGYAKEQLDDPVGRKVERGIRRLEARLKHLAELREKYDKVDRSDADRRRSLRLRTKSRLYPRQPLA